MSHNTLNYRFQIYYITAEKNHEHLGSGNVSSSITFFMSRSVNLVLSLNSVNAGEKSPAEAGGGQHPASAGDSSPASKSHSSLYIFLYCSFSLLFFSILLFFSFLSSLSCWSLVLRLQRGRLKMFCGISDEDVRLLSEGVTFVTHRNSFVLIRRFA